MMLALLSKWRGGASSWLAQRTQREYVLMGTALAAATIALFIAVVWSPLAELRASALLEIARHEAVLARVRAAAPRLRARGIAQEPVPPARAITESAAAFALTIRRMEPEGVGTRVILDDTDFSNLINWLVALERDHALRVAAIEMERRPAPGIVSARIMLQN